MRSGRRRGGSFADRGGRKIGKAVRGEALHAVGGVAGLVEHQDGRNLFNVERLVHAIGEDQSASEFPISKKRRDEGFILIGVDRQEDHIVAA